LALIRTGCSSPSRRCTQGTQLDQHLVWHLLNPFCSGPSMARPKGDGLRDKEIECARHKVIGVPIL
jgi:hypothetical protein